MTSDSRTLAAFYPAGAKKGESSRSRQLLLAVLWSPSIVLTGIVHVLCLPLTKRLLMAAVVLDIPLQWGKHIATRGGAEMGAMDGFDLSITTLSLAGLYLGWLFTERIQRRTLRIVWNWPIAAYTAAVITSLVVAADVELALYEAFLMLELFLLYVFFAANLTSREDVERMIRLLLIGGIVESLYILALAAIGHEVAFIRAIGFKSVIYNPGAEEGVRFGGTIGSPNSAAAYLAMVITLALMVWFLSVPGRVRRIAKMLLPVAPAALVVTLSRGGWVEVVVSALILLVAVWRRTGITRRRIILIPILLSIILAFLYVPNPVSKRFKGDDNGSAQSRIPLMKLAGNMIADNAALGVGVNNFAAVMQRYEGPEFRHAWIYTVHNQFLLVWAETGIIGLLAYLWILGNLMRRGLRLWRERGALFAPLGLGIVAILGGLLPHMMVEDFSSRPITQFLWLLAALLTACEVIQNRERLQDRAAKERDADAEPAQLASR